MTVKTPYARVRVRACVVSFCRLCPPPHEFLHGYILNPKHKLKRGLNFHTAASQTRENNNKKRGNLDFPHAELVKSTCFFFKVFNFGFIESASILHTNTPRSVFMSTVLIYSGCWRRVISLFRSFCLEEMTTPHARAHTLILNRNQ